MNEDFKKWALSYSGCDGGNLDGEIWFCGIEPGGGDLPKNFNEISEPPERPGDFFDNSRYNQNTAKLCAAIKGKKMENYRELNVFKKNSNSFKLNLYPINLPGDSYYYWNKEHFEKTGFLTKESYRVWCQENRFPKIRNWMKTHSPKIIVATGSTYKLDFLLAFDEPELIFEDLKKPSPAEFNNFDLYLLPVNSGKTLLAITPFLGGPNGLNSYEKIGLAGKRIREKAEEHFGKNCLQPDC